MNKFIPVNRIFETERLIAFYHPQPAYPLHILLVPKKAIASLIDLSEEDDTFLVDLVSTTQWIVKQFSLDPGGYRLITNGGKYQEIPQLHFHLISENFSQSP